MASEAVNEALIERLVEGGWADAETAARMRPHAQLPPQAFLALIRQWGRIPEDELAKLCGEVREVTRADVEATVLQDASAPIAAALEAPRHPSHVGRYEVTKVLGEGGMGVVYKARDPELDRPVAIKMLLAGEHASLESLDRFLTEAQTLEKLREHPNIVKVLGSGREGRSAYIVMEYVEGRDLKGLIAAGKVKPWPAARVVADIAGALALAHEKGIIHRDIKPANILIDKTSRARLADFGIAKVSDAGGPTMTGSVLGTYSYMAPEQAEDSSKVDERTDVYGLGAVLYECLTGRPPHVGSTAANVFSSLLTKAPPPPRELNPELDPALERITLKALAKDPAQRYQSCLELQAALNEARAGGDPEPAAPRQRRSLSGLIAGGLLALCIAVPAAWLALRTPPVEPEGPVAPPVEAERPAEPPPAPAAPELRLAPSHPSVIWVRSAEGPAEVELRLEPTGAEAAELALVFEGGLRLSAPVEDGQARFPQVAFGERAELNILGNAPGLDEPKRLGTLTLRRDAVAPVVRLRPDAPGSGPLISRTRRFLLKGEVEEEHLAELRIEPAPARDLSEGGRIAAEFDLPAGAPLRIRVSARDEAGGEGAAELEVLWREQLLELSVEGEARRVTAVEQVELRGRFAPLTGRLQARLGEAVLAPEVSGDVWRLQVPASEVERRLVIRLEAGGEALEREVTILQDVVPPAVTSLSGGGLNLEQLEGRVEGAEVELAAGFSEPVRWRLEEQVEGGWRALAEGEGESAELRAALSSFGKNDLRFVLEDGAGLKGELAFRVERPELEGSVSLDVADAAEGIELRLLVPKGVTGLRWEPSEGSLRQEGAGDGLRLRLTLPPAALRAGRLKLWYATAAGEQPAELRVDREMLRLRRWREAWTGAEARLEAPFTLAVLAARLWGDFALRGVEVFRCGEVTAAIAVFEHRATKARFHLIPGSRKVEPFLCAQTELTAAQWVRYDPREEMSKANLQRSRFSGTSPAIQVSYDAAAAGLAAMCEGEGLRAQLPTITQWVYACHGGSEEAWFWGADASKSETYVHSGEVRDTTQHVKAQAWNGFGLVDMIGNVREWVAGDAPDQALFPAGGPQPPLDWGFACGGHAVQALTPERLRCDVRDAVPKAEPQSWGAFPAGRQGGAKLAIAAHHLATGLRPVVPLPERWWR